MKIGGNAQKWELQFEGIKGQISRYIIFGSAFLILMNTASPALLSEGCIRQLYTHNRCQARQPIVQLLDYEESQANDKEITIRVSDGHHFVDCTLSGNYQIAGSTICETKNATTLTHFRKMHIVKIVDYFSKLDETRICKLKMIVRKMIDIAPNVDMIGNPLEIQQSMTKSGKQSVRTQTDTLRSLQEYTSTKKHHREHQQEIHSGKSEDTCIKLQNIQGENSIHLMTTPQQPAPTNLAPQLQHSASPHLATVVKPKKEMVPQSHPSGLGEPLTLGQILSGRQGFLIGRLIRFKTTRKETKDGPMTVCYLGMLDKNQELIRIHLAGRLAMNNEKTLKKNKCYYVRGFDLVTIKNSGVQIRLKDKEYKILEIHNEDYIRQLNTEYFHWDHENEIENEYVDVIGIVEDIEDKTTYNSNNQIDYKSVIRVVVRNKYKSIRISFWTDQMKNLESFNLKKKEAIVFEDVRKKQSKYYDFGFESSLLKVSEHPQILQKYQDLLPAIVEQHQPRNIKQLCQIYEQEPNNTKLRTIQAYLTGCPETNIIYRLCDDCKKKVQKKCTECHDCGGQNLVFKYNCRLQFADSTGSLVCILFDIVANKLIGRTANQVSEMSEEELQEIFEPLYYRLYSLTVEDRNQRLIMRSIELVSESSEAVLAKYNVEKIREVVCPSQLWALGIKM